MEQLFVFVTHICGATRAKELLTTYSRVRAQCDENALVLLREPTRTEGRILAPQYHYLTEHTLAFKLSFGRKLGL